MPVIFCAYDLCLISNHLREQNKRSTYLSVLRWIFCPCRVVDSRPSVTHTVSHSSVDCVLRSDTYTVAVEALCYSVSSSQISGKQRHYYLVTRGPRVITTQHNAIMLHAAVAECLERLWFHSCTSLVTLVRSRLSVTDTLWFMACFLFFFIFFGGGGCKSDWESTFWPL